MTQVAMPTQTVTGVLEAEGAEAEAEVRVAARAFAEALAESAEFQAFEQASDRLRQDETAQRAIGAYQTKQQSLQAMLMLKAVSAKDQAELERLRQAFLSHPTVAAYLQAQENLTAMCQAAADVLSQRIGLSFTAACGPGCC
jgi:cell fate (sporulation/competence/biofilm development) regulator YlbF (YheA/YmcA/DUF963 family)